MRYGTLVLTFAALSLWAGNPTHGDEAKDARRGEVKGGFVPKDLSGWEGLSEYWSIKDGALVGSTFPDGGKFNTFLCSKKKYKDFALHFQVRLKGKGWTGNSGV